MSAARRRHDGFRGGASPIATTGATVRSTTSHLGINLIGLDAATGERLPGFGTDGIVDLKRGLDQEIDLVTGEIGLHATPVIVGGTIVVGAAHLPGGSPESMTNVKGFIRGFDVSTGARKWIFHTIPLGDEFGNDTWQGDSWRYTGNTRGLGADFDRPGARARLPAGRNADERLLRRSPARRQPVLRQPGRGRPGDR